MKWTKLSLVAALAVSSAVAGGDIDPVEPVVAPVVEASATTINGKLTGYYYTDDAGDSTIADDDMFGDRHQLALGATLDVSHKFTDWLTANFSAVGYINTIQKADSTLGYFFESNVDEGYGAYFQIANLTATFDDTTLVAGRQLLGTPMIQGYDWLLAPGSFEAITAVNNSIENVSLVGSYVFKHRGNNTGEFGKDLDGDNWTVGASYDDKTISGSIWYNNIDGIALVPTEYTDAYSQVYVDLGYNFGSFKLEGQYVSTDFDTLEDSTAYGIMASTSLAGFDLSAAYNKLSDGATGFVGWNSLYTNQWNLTVANQYKGEDLDAFKVAAATTIMDISTEVSYADYENGKEFDLILGYEFTDAIDAGIVYTNTEVNYASNTVSEGDWNQLEVYVNYKF